MSGSIPKLEQPDARFRAVAQLGQGGTANVTLAVASGPSGFSKLVVLKSMRSHLRLEPNFSSMFLDEARLAARLNHPNIVQTNEVFEASEGPVIVMEYLEGQPLSNIIHRAGSTNKFSCDMQIRVISELLSGLHYAHELTDFDGRPLNVVHRDVSPHNVIVTFEGQVKLLDFGIAKLSGSRTETATGIVKGKLRYMAPEQISGEPTDRRLDLFAVGVMSWEAAAGQKMWPNLREAAIMNRILNDELPELAEANPRVHPELLRIVHKALERDPADRYQTALELQSELEAYLEQREGSVRLRDLGRVVSELFAADRAETRRIVDAQLAKVSALSAAEYAATLPIELTQIGTDSGLSANSAKEDQSDAAAHARSWQWLSLSLVPALALALFLLWRQRADATSALAGATQSVASTVTLNVTAFPAAARLYLDGEPIATNPLFRTVPRDAREHRIEARASGYVSEVRPLSFDQNANLVLKLSALAAPSSASQSPTVAASSKPQPNKHAPAKAASSSDGKPSVDCTQPYTLDSEGVKRFKPECL
jgi:eukaryotic-like serine/threonine-protein kinase